MTVREETLIRKKEVLRMTGIASGSLYYMRKTGQFPEGVKLSKRNIGWRKSEVEAWISSRPSI